jgi:hypothetical protein
MHRSTTTLVPVARSRALSRLASLLTLVLLPLLAACGTVSTSDDAAAAPPAPRAELSLNDLDGAVLEEKVVVDVAPEAGTVAVRLLLDGAPLTTVDEPPFLLTLDPDVLGEGSFELSAEAVRSDGTSGATTLARFTVGGATGDADPTTPPTTLSWSPPALQDPITIRVGTTGGVPALERDRDYLIVMPSAPRTEGLVLNGGRNVVLIGGEIAIGYQGKGPTINARRGLYITNASGVVHVEGLLVHGDDLSEGIQISAPQAIVQLQNVAVRNVHARDQVGFTDNHPDVIQTWGSVGELRVDGFTGETDYQGIFFKADYNGPHGGVHLRRVNMRSMPTTRYQVWMDDRGGRYPSVSFDDVWVEPRPGGSFEKSIWPDVDHARHAAVVVDGRASWPTLPVEGSVQEGVPPGGDFVPVERVGLGYVSPGYEGDD